MQMIESILAGAAAIAAVRRDIQAHPELSLRETRTPVMIAQLHPAWGIPISRGQGTPGVVAALHHARTNRPAHATAARQP